MAVIDDLRAERATIVDEIDALMQGEFDPNDKTLVEARSKADAIDGKIKSLVEWSQRRNAANEIDAISVRGKKAEEEKKETRESALSLGEHWIRSKAYTDYRQTPRGNSAAITLPLDVVQTRAPVLTTSFPGLIQPDRIAPSTAPYASTPFLDLIGRVAVSGNSVEWVYFSEVPPKPAAPTAEGAAKPEAAVAPELRTVTLQTLAHWISYSRQFGEDAGGLLAYINAALARGLMELREDLAVAELVADTEVPTTPGDDLISGIRLAIADVQGRGFNPTAVVLNPADYANLDITVFGSTLLGPSVNSSFWGVRPVPVPQVAAGTAFVGDFGSAMVELVRNEVQVYTTDSHADNFTKNLLVTVVECRTAPIVHRAQAVSKVTTTAPIGAQQAQARKQ